MKKKPRSPAWDYLEYISVRSFAALINSLPIAFSTWIARRVGDVFYSILPMRRKIALKNLDIAFENSITHAKKKHIAREAFQNLAASVMEFFRLPSLLKEAPERFEIEGTEHLDSALQKGKGVVFVVSHLGSWECLSFLFYLRSYSCTVVVRGTNNPYISKWIQTLRNQTRVHAIERAYASKKILRCLKQNEMAAILIDQWAGSEGVWADFFGEKTSTTSIPARLVHRTGAALIPGYCIRTGTGHFKIMIKPEVLTDKTDPEFEMKTTLKLNRQLENEIRRYTEQWTWTHRRWKGLERYTQNKSAKQAGKGVG